MNSNRNKLVLICLLIIRTAIAGAQVSPIVKDNAKPVLISNEFSFTEGPATDRKGNIFFTDQPNNKIWKYNTKGQLTLFMDNAGRSNGMFFDRKGNLLTCADENNQLWAINKRKQKTVLLDNLNGKLFNGPNDVWVSSRGDIYFTDPYYKRSYWTRTQEPLSIKGLYVIYKGETQATLLDSNFLQPNGITGSSRDNILYVADIRDSKTYKYTILADGSLSARTLFVNKGSDGMTLDSQGNLYTTGKDVVVFNREGKQIEHIVIPGTKTTNLSFYGKKRDKLFITTGNGICLLEMKVREGK